jgi:hypothetical protein
MLELHFSNADISSSQWPQSFYIRIYIRRTVRVSVVDPDPVGSDPFWPGRIRIWNICTGSRSDLFKPYLQRNLNKFCIFFSKWSTLSFIT